MLDYRGDNLANTITKGALNKALEDLVSLNKLMVYIKG